MINQSEKNSNLHYSKAAISISEREVGFIALLFDQDCTLLSSSTKAIFLHVIFYFSPTRVFLKVQPSNGWVCNNHRLPHAKWAENPKRPFYDEQLEICPMMILPATLSTMRSEGSSWRMLIGWSRCHSSNSFRWFSMAQYRGLETLTLLLAVIQTGDFSSLGSGSSNLPVTNLPWLFSLYVLR